MQCVGPLRFGFAPIFNIWKRHILSVRTWLYCFDFNITSMQLVNGQNPNEGEVQVQIGSRWGSIIMEGQRNTSQEKTVGSVVCKILGYVGVSEIFDASVKDYDNYTWMSNLFCNGNETALTDCSYTKGGYFYDKIAVKCEDTDQCQSNPCLNNGTCVDGDRSYTCNCTERWSGINCEIDTDQCQSNPCLKNGICVDGDRSYTCKCTERWSGINCEIDTDQCQSNPCLNNGTCVDGDRSYTCNCTERWSGINCEIDKDACLSQPCENNGACVNEINGFVCYCDQGYEGYRCQNEIGDQTTFLVVLISSICVLSIVIATVCCCYRYRREHKKTKTDASNVLGKEGLQNSKEVEAVQTEMEEGHYNEEVYDEIKENNVADHADYIHPVNDVELPRDADGYVKFADNDESVGYYKLKHTKTEDYSKLS
ncbi:fibropellin-1-like isoform X1 [Ruditapes philippinarum]|uniref:fibropellin-1-like isoform X1 n=1 Tax=Ruditapes philippinarum TaxID=129788 RepID=UPI00295ABADD|nr:fibropellin-1-like isoform X1 [Ruditapes philippinarum]